MLKGLTNTFNCTFKNPLQFFSIFKIALYALNVKVKSPYFTSVARNSHLTNKPEASGALILTLLLLPSPYPHPLPPLTTTTLSISASFNRYLKELKATRTGNKSKEGFVFTHIKHGSPAKKATQLPTAGIFLPCCFSVFFGLKV